MDSSSKEETLKQAHDEVASLKASLSEKENAMRHLLGTHEKSQTTLKEEIAKLEAEKRNLLSSLDEANLNREEMEGTVGSCKEEIQRLRSLLAESQKKCKETDEWARSGKEAKMREELLIQFEEERNKVEDQLKWKLEQFSHLEDAFKKLQSELRELRGEKEVEKLELLSKINELELGLDEKTRLCEDLRTRLEICNQVLAREESKRKLLEVELRESRDRYDILVTDFELAKSAVESVTVKRDEEIASLRCILADKSLQIKEIEFEKAQVEEENRELRGTVKEYREIEIGGVEKSKKFRVLEKAHKGCGEKIRVRENEIANLKRDLDDSLARLHEKEEIVEKLQNELKGSEKIRVGEVEMENEIANLKRDLDESLARLHEKEEIVEKLQEKIRVGEVEMENEIANLKRDLDDSLARLHEKEEIVEKLQNELKVNEKIRVGEIEMENEIANLKRDLDDSLARLHEKEEIVEKLQNELKEGNKKIRVGEVEMENLKGIIEKLQNELQERDLKQEIEMIKSEEETWVAFLVIKENLKEHFKKCRKSDVLILANSDEEKEVNNLKQREEALIEERERLLCQVGEKNGLMEQVNECMEREKALVRENERLICEVREREEVIERLNVERENERKQVMKELEVCKEREQTLVKEKEMLLGECKEREEALVRESERLICEVREREEMIEQLNVERENERKQVMKELEVCKERVQTLVKEKEMLLGECKEREEALVRESEKLICEVREREEMIEQLNVERENERKQVMKELEVCKERVQTLVKEKEMLLGECKEREEALVRESEKLICEVREREEMIEQLNVERENERKQVMKELEVCKEREQTLVKEKEMLLGEVKEREEALVRESERLICEVREREEVIEQLYVEKEKFFQKEKLLEKENERLQTLVKEKEMLLGEVKEREEALVRESERFCCEIREREGLIEELKGEIALSREHNSKFGSEVCSLEEEKMKFVEIGNEMAKKLLEIKFKLDPLEEKCTEFTKEKRNEISGLKMNLEFLVEELESSVSEKEQLQLELQEMATAYFVQKHETEFREQLISDLEMEMEILEMNLRVKEKRFEAELERERLENQGKRVRFSNEIATAYIVQIHETEFREQLISDLEMEMKILEMNSRVKEERFEAQLETERLENQGKRVRLSNEIKRLHGENETLVLQIHDLNCGIGSLFCGDGEIKAISERILQKMRNEGENTNEKKFKLLVPVSGTRSPLKENNF